MGGKPYETTILSFKSDTCELGLGLIVRDRPEHAVNIKMCSNGVWLITNQEFWYIFFQLGYEYLSK